VARALRVVDAGEYLAEKRLLAERVGERRGKHARVRHRGPRIGRGGRAGGTRGLIDRERVLVAREPQVGEAGRAPAIALLLELGRRRPFRFREKRARQVRIGVVEPRDEALERARAGCGRRAELDGERLVGRVVDHERARVGGRFADSAIVDVGVTAENEAHQLVIERTDRASEERRRQIGQGL
jgi:hypothetical protein